MQRKNYILKTSRKGMAMIMAISVILIIATIMALSLTLTSQTAKKTTDLYLYEQANILSHSAAEYAMLRLSEEALPCDLPSINFQYNNTYDINITMQYISLTGSPCNLRAIADGTDFDRTTTPQSDGTVIMDIAVTANPTGTVEPIRYFRRSIQKL